MKGTTPGSSEIVQVEGGQIIRSTTRKDRHSKVYTSKGPRDRRVRLAAHTAIQFYDVQDRLGYDRPSKAVDWLINKAQTAIQNLTSPTDLNPSSKNPHPNSVVGDDSNFLKSFFPATSFPGDDSVSRASFHGEELGLSLHSFQEGFQRIDGWNNGTDMGSRVGFGINAPGDPFSQRELIVQSNLAWNHQRPIAYNTDEQNAKSWDFQSPFEVGFRVPTRIYGEEEPINHR